MFERNSDGQKGGAIFSGSLETVRVGEHLHVAAVRAKPDSPTSANKLLAGSIYYYDLAWGRENLAAHRADLVYGDKDPLPSFMVPPLKLNELRHSARLVPKRDRFRISMPSQTSTTSCRESWDDTAKNWNNPRPHQLFLTGDQIYADEGNDILLNLVGEAGGALLAGFQGDAFSLGRGIARSRRSAADRPGQQGSRMQGTGGFKNPSKLYPGLRTVRKGELCLGFRDTIDELQPFILLSEGFKLTAKTRQSCSSAWASISPAISWFGRTKSGRAYSVIRDWPRNLPS